MWLMLQQKVPDDYVIATGESHSVSEFCQEAFSHAGLDYKEYVKTDPAYFRPAEVDFLQGDPSKAKEKLGWTPHVGFAELARMMVDADIKRISEIA
jgi:GDPmannose 4,6-dehydratase